METIEFDVVKIKKRIISGLNILKKWLVYAVCATAAGFVIYYSASWILRERPKPNIDDSSMISTVQTLESALGYDNAPAFLKTSSKLVTDIKRDIDKNSYAPGDKEIIAKYRNQDTRMLATIDKSRRKIAGQLHSEQAWERRSFKKAYTALERSLEEPDTVLWASMNASNMYNPFNDVDRLLPFTRLKTYLRLAGLSIHMSQTKDSVKWLDKADEMVKAWYDNTETEESLVHPCYAQAFIMLLRNKKSQALDLMSSVPLEQSDIDIEKLLKRVADSESPSSAAARLLYKK